MLKRNLKSNVRRTLRIGIAVMLLCGFVAAQKSRQPVSAEDYARRGAAKMKVAESLTNPAAAVKKYLEAIENFNVAIGINEEFIAYDEELGCVFKSLVEETKLEQAVLYLQQGKCLYKTSAIDGAIRNLSKAIELDRFCVRIRIHNKISGTN